MVFLKEILEYILKQILSDDVDFTVSENLTESGETTFTIEVPEEYKGQLIGRRGKHINSIRQVLGVAARKQGKRISINIAE